MQVRRTLIRNGQPVDLATDGGETLLDVLRGLGVASLGRGCTHGSCGACRVLLDGVLVSSCTVHLVAVDSGATVETYEDLQGEPSAVTAVDAFIDERPTRCMLCVPSVGVTAVSLARRGVARDRAAVAKALEAAACTCTGRGSLRRALLAK